MLELHPILPQHTLSWVRIRALAYYGPTHVLLHSGRPVSEDSMRGAAKDWKRQIGKDGMWHWRVVDTDLPPSEDDLEGEGEEGGDGEEVGRTVGIAVWSMHNVKVRDEEKGEEEGESKPFVPRELRVDAVQSLLGPLRDLARSYND